MKLAVVLILALAAPAAAEPAQQVTTETYKDLAPALSGDGTTLLLPVMSTSDEYFADQYELAVLGKKPGEPVTIAIEENGAPMPADQLARTVATLNKLLVDGSYQAVEVADAGKGASTIAGVTVTFAGKHAKKTVTVKRGKKRVGSGKVKGDLKRMLVAGRYLYVETYQLDEKAPSAETLWTAIKLKK